MKEPLYIFNGVRTPFCKMGTDLASVSAVELGRSACAHLLSTVDIDPGEISETIIGCVGQPADAANLGRVVSLRSGVPEHVPAITVHRNCASGFEAVTQAAEKMLAGRGELYLVGGTESMSQYPLLYNMRAQAKFTQLMRSKTLKQKLSAMLAFRPADFSPRIGLQLGLHDPVSAQNMGQTAENLARDFGITREEQDRFAYESHARAVVAQDKLAEEIAPVYPEGKGGRFVERDNGPRKEQSMQALGKLRTVFDRQGSVTPGNASQITDGAVALLVGSEAVGSRLGLKPIGRLIDYAYAGCDPSRMGIGPLHAMARLEKSSGLTLEDADLIEINEAFAAQVIACMRGAQSEEYCRDTLGRKPLGEIDPQKLNVNGGAIALGHPVGATGARLVLTALKELERRNAKRALVSLCIGGGQGGALWLERI